MPFDMDSAGPLLLVIVAGEVGFWVLIGAGLVARYLLRRVALGAVLLLGTPLTDLIVLAATVVDLRAGGDAEWVHGLAATYVGVSVAFGRNLVRWADQRFAHRFAGGPPPWRPPRSGRARIRYEWRLWAQFALAWAIGCGLLLVLLSRAEPGADTGQLWGWMARLTAVLVVWFAGWPLWRTLSERRSAGAQVPS